MRITINNKDSGPLVQRRLLLSKQFNICHRHTETPVQLPLRLSLRLSSQRLFLQRHLPQLPRSAVILKQRL